MSIVGSGAGANSGAYVAAEESISVGQAVVVDGLSGDGGFAAVFEDDGDTGYFYALDMSNAGRQIQDAVHIYNVANVVDRDMQSTIKIVWAADDRKVLLLINDIPHAAFDFTARYGYARTNFPPPASEGSWTRSAWDKSVEDLFR